MLLRKELLETFIEAVESLYGLKVTRAKPETVGWGVGKHGPYEYGRFLIGEAFFVIRKPGRIDSEAVEVWCSDLKKMQEVESYWVAKLKEMVYGNVGESVVGGHVHGEDSVGAELDKRHEGGEEGTLSGRGEGEEADSQGA